MSIPGAWRIAGASSTCRYFGVRVEDNGWLLWLRSSILGRQKYTAPVSELWWWDADSYRKDPEKTRKSRNPTGFHLPRQDAIEARKLIRRSLF